MSAISQKNFFHPLATSNFVDLSVHSTAKLVSSTLQSSTKPQYRRIQKQQTLPLSPGLALSTILAFLSREFQQYHKRATEDDIGVKLSFDNTISEFDRWDDGVFFEREDVIDMTPVNEFFGVRDDARQTWNWGDMFGDFGFIFGFGDIKAKTEPDYNRDRGDTISISASEDDYQMNEDYQPARTIIH